MPIRPYPNVSTVSLYILFRLNDTPATRTVHAVADRLAGTAIVAVFSVLITVNELSYVSVVSASMFVELKLMDFSTASPPFGAALKGQKAELVPHICTDPVPSR